MSVEVVGGSRYLPTAMHLRPVLVCACAILALARAASILPPAAPAAAAELHHGITQYEGIPVAIVAHDSLPILKASDNDIPVSRDKVDLTLTGPPQRQEHDSQSPETFNTEQKAVASIKQTITDSQNAIEGVSSGLQSWLTNNQQLITIKDNVQKLQANFQSQIGKLNATLQNFWKPEEPSPVDAAIAAASTQETILDQVGQSVKQIESKLEYGVKSMVDSIHASVKQEQTNVSESNNPFNAFTQYLQQFQTSIASSFNNLTSTIQNYINQNQQGSESNNTVSGPTGFFQNIGAGIQNIIGQQNAGGIAQLPGGAQSDEQATTKPPTIWQGIQTSIQNIWRPGQSGNQPATPAPNRPTNSGPIAQAIQNNPVYQGVVNLIQPKPTETPETPVATPEGANQVPAGETAAADPIRDSEKQKPEVPDASGPIKQLVQKNPLMQGLATAVNRIQNTLVNPERPRETEKAAEDKGEEKLGHKPVIVHQQHTPAQVTAWSNFVNGLIGTIGAVIGNTTTAVSTSVNSAIGTVGDQVTSLVTALTGVLG